MDLFLMIRAITLDFTYISILTSLMFMTIITLKNVV